MTAFTKDMIVISFDCLAAIDYSLIETLPNFQRVFENGSFCKRVRTIYPSLTYPCHSSIVTGKYPKNHGVVNNTLIQPGSASPDWNWYRSAIKGTTLYDEAYKANLSTAALLWPVTAKAKSIQYNLPEIFANRPWQNQIAVSLLNGTASYQWELNKLYGSIRNGLSQPELDDFVLESTVHTILSKNPNLMLVHFTDLDTMRHYYGVRSQEAIDAIHRHDKRLGRILDALEESGQFAETTIVILGDHAALDENKAVNLNVCFHEQNLITVNPKGKIKDWKAYCKGCDGSAYIYLNDPADGATKDKVEGILRSLMTEPNNGIENIITGEEAGKLGADPNCTFMIEAANGFYFIEDHLGEFIKEVTEENRLSNPKFLRACHGCSPDKQDYQTFFLASGKGVQPNQEISSMGLIDIGPTLAKLLGLDLGEIGGQAIESIISV